MNFVSPWSAAGVSPSDLCSEAVQSGLCTLTVVQFDSWGKTRKYRNLHTQSKGGWGGILKGQMVKSSEQDPSKRSIFSLVLCIPCLYILWRYISISVLTITFHYTHHPLPLPLTARVTRQMWSAMQSMFPPLPENSGGWWCPWCSCLVLIDLCTALSSSLWLWNIVIYSREMLHQHLLSYAPV